MTLEQSQQGSFTSAGAPEAHTTSRSQVAGANFAKAAQTAQERITRFYKPSRDATLGLKFAIHPQTDQVIVWSVVPGGPAEQSGTIGVGDVITMVLP